MKALLFLAIFISGIGYAQTNIIAAKSHGSNAATSTAEVDNFGLPDETRIVKRVKYLKDDCIIETCEVTMWETEIVNDTICDHPFLKKGYIDVDRIKAMYPEGTKFSGFDQIKKLDKKATRKAKRKNRSKKSTGIIFLLIGGSAFLMYLFTPKLNKVRT